MKPSTPHIKSLGDAGILLQFKDKPSEQLLLYMLGVRKHLCTHLQCEVVHTYNELLIKKPPLAIPISEIIRLLDTAPIDDLRQRKMISIPVCYGGTFGEDLAFLAETKNRSQEEIIALHTAPEYLVYFIGFLPGFLYLEGLNSTLNTPRKETPRLKVAQGSVAIGGNQTGIYPQESPGGWHIIGRTPLHLFDQKCNEPTPFAPGDVLKFEQITVRDYDFINDQVDRGAYTFKTRVL